MPFERTRVKVRRVRKRTLRPLFPHQRAARRYAGARDHVALFLEMRLGKTLVTIRSLRDKKCERVLIVAPLSVLPSWESELDAEGIRSTNLHGSTPGRDVGWCTINYEGLFRRRSRKVVGIHPGFLSLSWDAVVLDESARIRNPKAKTTKYLCESFRHVPHRYLLTGLPAPEDPLDYVQQFIFLHGHFMGYDNYWYFRKKFYKQLGYDWIPKPGVRGEIKRYVQKNALVQSRKKVGLANKKIYETRWVPMNAKQKALIKQAVEDFELDALSTKWQVVVHSWLAQIAGGLHPETKEVINDAKAKELLTLLNGELKGQQMVVFSRFNDQLFHLETLLKKGGFTYDTLTGATKERGKVQDRFHAGTTQVLLCQLKVAQYGLNLSCASVGVYYSNSFAYEERAQSEDRIEHVMKKEPLLLIDLVTKDSHDEDVLSALRGKKVDSRFYMQQVQENFMKRRAA